MNSESWITTFVVVWLFAVASQPMQMSHSLLFPLLWVLWVPPLFPKRPFRFSAVILNIPVVILGVLMAWGTWFTPVISTGILCAATAARTAETTKQTLAFVVISLYTWLSVYGMVGMHGGALLVWQWVDHVLLDRQRRRWIPAEEKDHLVSLWNVWSTYAFYVLAYAQPETWQTAMAVFCSPAVWDASAARNPLKSFVWTQVLACVVGAVYAGVARAFLVRIFLCTVVLCVKFEVHSGKDVKWKGTGAPAILCHLIAITLAISALLVNHRA